MQPRDGKPRTAPTATGADEASLGDGLSQLPDMLAPGEETARGMLEAEGALRLVRQRFERTEDPQQQEELAAEALDHVERQLQLLRDRRRQLDSAEAKLWARQNRLEGFLIQTRGSDWWHARRESVRSKAVSSA
jgi:hypothetical protein